MSLPSSPFHPFRLRVKLLRAIGFAVATGAFPILLPASGAEAPPARDDRGIADFFPRHYPNLFDSEDGQLDLSKVLDQPFGFFPLVTPITEPAVGYGAAFIPIFIDLPNDRKGRPNIWAAGAMATSNGTEGFFAGYSGYFDDDQWHVYGAAADASVNLDFNGLGNVSTPSGNPLRYNLDVTGGLIGADRKIGETPWRAGLRYLYGEVDPSLDRAGDAPLINSAGFISRFGPFDFTTTVSSLQPTLSYDTRNNIFTPTKGVYSELSITANIPAIGASDEYQILAYTGIWYRPVIEDTLFFAIRGDIIQSFGDVPFYRRPAVSLRGAPAQRYQGAGVAFSEAELRWQFNPRWSVLAFAGTGVTWPGNALFQETQNVFTGGAGFRYLIARRYGLQTGIDLGFGEDGAALYIQFGSAWFRP